MAYRIEDDQWNNLISKIDSFDVRLSSGKRSWESEKRDQDIINGLRKENEDANRTISMLKQQIASADYELAVKTKAEAQQFDAETKKKRKEIEDLAYNKGYVAGYVEITQKLGKTN